MVELPEGAFVEPVDASDGLGVSPGESSSSHTMGALVLLLALGDLVLAPVEEDSLGALVLAPVEEG
jgi:hypothetical protein